MAEHTVHRSSVTGLFVSDEYAKAHPDTTQAETVSVVREGFHARDGWYFRRDAAGNVIVELGGPLNDGGRRTEEGAVTFDPSTWASIVASVSAKGETGETFGRALQLHTEPVYLPDMPDPAGYVEPGA